MIYFTSDTHWHHANVIKFDNRPFRNVDEMNEAMIANWNGVVGNGDVIYHLGDFSFGNKNQTRHVLERLNGQIHLIIGNHDNGLLRDCSRFFASVQHYADVRQNEHRFILFHYPILEWHHCQKGTMHLHGHVHSTREENESQIYRRYDVGVSANNYTPVSADMVIEFLKDKEIMGHHR